MFLKYLLWLTSQLKAFLFYYLLIFQPDRLLHLFHCFLPNDDGATLCRGDLGTEVLQVQQFIGGELVGLRGRCVCQPAVVGRGGGAAAPAPALGGPLQTDALSALHHGPQLQHQGVGHQLFTAALTRHFGLKGEDCRPGKHLGKVMLTKKPTPKCYIKKS